MDAKVYCGECKWLKKRVYFDSIFYIRTRECKKFNLLNNQNNDCSNYEPKLWVRFINLFKKEKE